MILKTSYNMKVPPSARLIKGHPLARGLVALWLANERCGLKVFDINDSNVLTAAGSPTWAVDDLGYCLQLAEVNSDYYQGTINHNIGTGDFTWIVKVRITTAATWSTFCSNGNFSPSFGSLSAITWGLFWAGNKAASTAVGVNTWDTYTAQRKNGTIYFFKNGVLDPNNYAVGNAMANGTFRVGYSGSPGEFLTGLISWMGFWHRALCASEIIQLCRDPLCMFERRSRLLYTPPGAPPEIFPLWMDLSSQAWFLKHSQGLYTKL